LLVFESLSGFNIAMTSFSSPTLWYCSFTCTSVHKSGYPPSCNSAKLHYTYTGTDMLYNNTNGHHQLTSSQQVVDVVQHVPSWLNLLYNILPATGMLYNTTNGRAHNNSTTCCTTNSSSIDTLIFATSQHLDMSRCWALALRCGKFVVQQVIGLL